MSRDRIPILFGHKNKSPFQSEVLNVWYWRCRPVLTNKLEALGLSVTYPSPWPRRGLRLGEELPPEDLVVVPGARLNSPPAKSPSLSSDGSFHWLSRDCCDWNAEECCCKHITTIKTWTGKKDRRVANYRFQKPGWDKICGNSGRWRKLQEVLTCGSLFIVSSLKLVGRADMGSLALKNSPCCGAIWCCCCFT